MRCRFKHKIFQNEENGYTIAIFTTQDTSVPLSARDKYLASRNIIGFSAIGFGLPLTDEIVNLDKLPPESQQSCIASIEENIEILKTYLEENLREKENDPEIPKTGMAVLQQQIVLADAIEKWIISLKKDF